MVEGQEIPSSLRVSSWQHICVHRTICFLSYWTTGQHRVYTTVTQHCSTWKKKFRWSKRWATVRTKQILYRWAGLSHICYSYGEIEGFSILFMPWMSSFPCVLSLIKCLVKNCLLTTGLIKCIVYNFCSNSKVCSEIQHFFIAGLIYNSNFIDVSFGQHLVTAFGLKET